MMWISGSTRPDVAVDVSILARALNSPTVHNALEANKALRYLKGSSEVGICYEKVHGKLSIAAFTDAAFQNINNEETQGGMLICIYQQYRVAY